MAITGPASYLPTINAFLSQWSQADAALAPDTLVVRLPDSDTTITRAQFEELRDTLLVRQSEVSGARIDQQIARGGITLAKPGLLKKLNLFTTALDACFRNTDFHDARPHAPSIGDGQETFLRPMHEAVNLWRKINAGPAPAGVTLPLVLVDGTTQESFAAAVAALPLLYAAELDAAQDLTLARARRNRVQARAYAIMKAFREAVPYRLAAHPDLVETLPRLTPLPGHTPAPVKATAIFQAPASAKITYDASPDPLLRHYELRGHVGDEYEEEDAVVLATRGPNDPREFVTPYGLNQPGAQVAFKVYVILTTDNEAGSAPMIVERSAEVAAMAA